MLDETEKAIPAPRRSSEAAAEEDRPPCRMRLPRASEADASDRIAEGLGLDECGQEANIGGRCGPLAALRRRNGGDQLTAEEFRQQADAICAEFEGRFDELGTPESLDDLQKYVGRPSPSSKEGNQQLDELKPPDELEEDWDRAMEVNRPAAPRTCSDSSRRRRGRRPGPESRSSLQQAARTRRDSSQPI